MNPGGPGGSGFDFVYDSVDFACRAPPAGQLRRHRLGSARRRPLDPRHVLRRRRPRRLICRPADAAPTPTRPAGSPRSPQSPIDFGQACLENTGPVLQFIDTHQHRARPRHAARDRRRREAQLPRLLVRQRRSARCYIDDFPDKVGRIVLDGATDSSISVFEVGLVQSAGFQLALENYLTACPDMFPDDCPFTGDTHGRPRRPSARCTTATTRTRSPAPTAA